MLKIIFKPEEGDVPDMEADGWNIEGEKKSVTRKEGKRLRD